MNPAEAKRRFYGISTPTYCESPQNIWEDPQFLADEITNKAQFVDYSAIIGQSEVLLLGENGHNNSSVRSHLANNSISFKERGISHFTLETPHKFRRAFLDIHRGIKTKLTPNMCAPIYSNNKHNNYEDTVRSLIKEGILVVPIDPNERIIDEEQRESELSRRITRIMRENRDHRVAALVGNLHVSRLERHHTISPLGYRLVEAGLDVVTVMFAGGNADIDHFSKATRIAQLAEEEFMLDVRHYKGHHKDFDVIETVDFVIHLPQYRSYSTNALGNVA